MVLWGNKNNTGSSQYLWYRESTYPLLASTFSSVIQEYLSSPLQNCCDNTDSKCKICKKNRLSVSESSYHHHHYHNYYYFKQAYQTLLTLATAMNKYNFNMHKAHNIYIKMPQRNHQSKGNLLNCSSQCSTRLLYNISAQARKQK